MSSLLGLSFIGFARGQSTASPYRATNPAKATALEPDFFPATAAEADRAGDLAAQATPILAALSGQKKAVFLRDIASRIEAATPALVARATQETGLPEAR